MAEVSWATWQSSVCIRACQRSGKAIQSLPLYIRNVEVYLTSLKPGRKGAPQRVMLPLCFLSGSGLPTQLLAVALLTMEKSLR